MNSTLRTALAALAFCFAGCATTTSQSIASHGPSGVRQPPTIAMSSAARTTGSSSYEQPAFDRAMSPGRGVDRGIPMPEPAREAIHALPTPQVPIPFSPAERTPPSYAGRPGGSAAYWQ